MNDNDSNTNVNSDGTHLEISTSSTRHRKRSQITLNVTSPAFAGHVPAVHFSPVSPARKPRPHAGLALIGIARTTFVPPATQDQDDDKELQYKPTDKYTILGRPSYTLY